MIICTGLAGGASARASAAVAATISENKTAENCLDRMRVCGGILGPERQGVEVALRIVETIPETMKYPTIRSRAFDRGRIGQCAAHFLRAMTHACSSDLRP